MNSVETPQFHVCFESEKFLIPSKAFRGEAKKYWLQQDAKMLTTFNRSSVDGSLKSQRFSKTATVSIPEIIAEKDKQFEIEVQSMRDQHKKEISFLEAKIRKLERQTK